MVRSTTRHRQFAVEHFAFAASPALLLALIELGGFRWAWRSMALVLVVVMASLIVLLHRGSPESCGLVIDGGLASTRTGPVVIGTEADLALAEAIRDLRFWAVAAPITAMSTTSTALTFHIIDFGAEVGMTDDEIARIFVPIAPS